MINHKNQPFLFSLFLSFGVFDLGGGINLARGLLGSPWTITGIGFPFSSLCHVLPVSRGMSINQIYKTKHTHFYSHNHLNWISCFINYLPLMSFFSTLILAGSTSGNWAFSFNSGSSNTCSYSLSAGSSSVWTSLSWSSSSPPSLSTI